MSKIKNSIIDCGIWKIFLINIYFFYPSIRFILALRFISINKIFGHEK